MLIINDLHVGVQRTGGTTLQSQHALRNHLRQQLADFLGAGHDDDVVVNGDLFDGFTVDVQEVIKTYEIFADWLHDCEGRLTLVMGNHDASAKGDKVSSFHLLCHFLKARFDNHVQVIDHTSGMAHIAGNVWAISHQLNQHLFDLEITTAIEKQGKGNYLLLHCNVKNTFAEHSDHSLNLSDEQVNGLMKAGWTLVVGHEHIGYQLREGRILVVGNQFPSSVADCLGNTEKHALQIKPDGHRYIQTWGCAKSFCRADWEGLAELGNDGHQFIRVEGTAVAAQAADVVNTIAKFRQRSSAFVITNAVKVEGVEGISDQTAESIENIKAFDVIGAIMEHLDEREQKVVKELIDA